MSFRATRLFSLAILSQLATQSFALTAETTDGKHFTQIPQIAPAKGQPDSAQPTPSVPAATLFKDGPAPSWIWGADEAKNYVVRKTFQGGGQSAWLRATCDNSMTVYLNGKKVASSDDFTRPEQIDIQASLKAGENILEAEVANSGGPAGFVAKLAITGADGKVRYVVTDNSWTVLNSRESKESTPAKVVLKLEDHPGGKAMLDDLSIEPARDLFNLLPGFQVERLFTVPKEELGSWVSITTDPKGRLIVSDQGKLGLCRITPPPIGSSAPTKVERLDIKFEGKTFSGAQGLLCAFDSLYVIVNSGDIPTAFYRCKDTDGDDQYDEVIKLRDIPGGGEHGPHALRLSPDGKSIYVDAGNHTKLPFEVTLNSPPQTMAGVRPQQLRATLPEGVTSRSVPNWDEDQLMPRQWDAGGHAVGVLAPGGWIAITDPDGKTWDVFSTGYRNQYDFAFNADGEVFAYDADMEWDYGSPWYRPTRVVHATSGSEFGWRSGTAKWPTYYPDSLPQLVDVGPGSPVGVEFGYGTKFPAKYQKALFICDWTFGTMYAVHVEPSGASYKATKEEFISRTPLPLTDVVAHPDGAMYFTVGGRGTQSELFRVTYVGKESTAPVDARNTRDAELRALRRKIETYHVANSEKPAAAVDFLVPHLGHADRHIRFAARIGLERLPVDLWQNKVFAATNPDAIITGCIGLARQGEPHLLPQILMALGSIDARNLTEPQQLGLLRALQLTFVRLGAPDEATKALIGERLDSVFPTNSNALNRELANLMVFVESPGTIKKILPLLTKEKVVEITDLGEVLARNKQYGAAIEAMYANAPDLQQYYYAYVLRNLKSHWTLEARKTYFSWFEKAHSWSGGVSYQKFLTNIENSVFEQLPESERIVLEASGARKAYKAPELPKPVGPGRDYTVDELVALSATQLRGRDFKNGERMYRAARCVVCHRFAGDGGSTGHDLTQAAGRFSFKDLAESIIDPSKVVSDQYKTTIVETADGKTHTGRIVAATADSITILVDPEDSTKLVTVKNSDIESQQLSDVSLMPKDLLKQLNENEVLDLLAYLLSRGNAQDSMFKR
ncbi:c-type cytochrome [Schlesneria sp.]|uniref:c-type cytochrome n=1 Tax=Schlesneria sp. TaxID=2762018 RepID=UPI002F09CB79